MFCEGLAQHSCSIRAMRQSRVRVRVLDAEYRPLS